MVAIVSGNSLGLELTSRDTLSGGGLLGLAGQGNAGELVYVNAATGNLVLQRRDEFIASRGDDLASVRTYNSLGLLNDDNADNWSIGIYRQQVALIGTVNTVGSSLVRTARDGSQATYLWNTERALYVTTDGAGAHDTIAYNTAAAQYERRDGSTGSIEKYAASTGRLISAADADGGGADYSYNDAGLLTKAVSTSGDTTWYDYQGTQLNAIRVQYGEGVSSITRTAVRYGYDAGGRLSSVTVDLTPEDSSITDGRVYVTNYTYDGASRRVQTVSQSDGSSLAFTYAEVGGNYRIKTTTDAAGSVTSFAYDTANRRTTVTDPLNKAWQYEYDAGGQLVSVITPATATMAASVQSFAYDSSGNVISVINGDGEVVAMVYDGNGNQLRQTDHLGNAVVRTYSASNQLLTETVTTATGSATTRYVYAANKPNQLRFVVSAEGRVTQYGYDSFGQRTRK
jgi:YD repeat-containing protein